LLYTTSLNFLYKEASIQQTELAEPLLYHGDANGSNFIEVNGFVFYFVESPITDA